MIFSFLCICDYALGNAQLVSGVLKVCEVMSTTKSMLKLWLANEN